LCPELTLIHASVDGDANLKHTGPSATSSRPVQQRRQGPRTATGIAIRHKLDCAIGTGPECTCTPSFQAQAWSAKDRKPIRRTFPTLAEAKAWRQETQVALRRGQLRAPTKTILTEAAREWLTAAQAGIIRTRSGDCYKPAALRTYRHSLNKHLLPELGRMRLTAISRAHVKTSLIDSSPQAPPPALSETPFCLCVRLPPGAQPRRGRGKPHPQARVVSRTRPARSIARPGEAAALLDALPREDRSLWATALYAGLRRGELRALRWHDIDLTNNLIAIERSWDPVAGPVEPKSRSGRRRIPLSHTLRRHLIAHRLHQGAKSSEELVFPNRNGRPFDPATLVARARKAWQSAGLEPIGLHECRHTYAAFMIAAGINAKALSTYMGHASITITLDRYGHLMPGNEHQAARMLDTYLDAARRAAR
jgi:integrase